MSRINRLTLGATPFPVYPGSPCGIAASGLAAAYWRPDLNERERFIYFLAEQIAAFADVGIDWGTWMDMDFAEVWRIGADPSTTEGRLLVARKNRELAAAIVRAWRLKVGLPPDS